MMRNRSEIELDSADLSFGRAAHGLRRRNIVFNHPLRDPRAAPNRAQFLLACAIRQFDANWAPQNELVVNRRSQFDLYQPAVGS
jgi:hypothetical protein